MALKVLLKMQVNHVQCLLSKVLLNIRSEQLLQRTEGFLKYTPRINLQSLPSVASEQSSHTEQTEVLTSLASELPSELTHDSPEDQPQITNPLEHPDYFGVSKMVSLRELFDARVHLGHEQGCWNQHMKPFIYGTRARYHVIDLNQTVEHLKRSLNVVSHIAYRKGIILFVTAFPRFERLIQETARESGEYFVTQQWRGGTLTNAVKVLGTTSVRLPDLIIFMNLNSLGHHQTALKEAAMCCIPTIGIVDTDCDPRFITYTVPGNDDTQSSMEIYCRLFQEAILNAKERRKVDMERQTEMDAASK